MPSRLHADHEKYWEKRFTRMLLWKMAKPYSLTLVLTRYIQKEIGRQCTGLVLAAESLGIRMHGDNGRCTSCRVAG
jgi:hypothetical protein